MALTWATLLAVLSLCYLLQALLRKTKHGKLPPGPRPLPILGHFHLVGKNPHQDLRDLAKKYGPIMCMRFGFVPNIVVSSPEAAELFLKTNDLVFAGRPPHEAAKYISYEQRNMSFAPYGHFWRTMRKLCTLELLSNHKIASFQSMRKEELSLLVDFIKKAASNSMAVDLSATVASMSADMSCRMVLGKKYEDDEFDDRGFKGVMKEAMQLSATPNLGDYFPFLGVLDLQGLTRRMKALSKVFDEFFEKIIDEHVQSKREGENEDFVDILLAFMKSEQAEFRIDRGHVKSLMLDMLVGSMDTSATAIEWLMSELLRHPQVLKMVQDELEKVVGLDKMVEESDLQHLQYLEMAVKESFRLHPVGPLLIPHESSEDSIINGYHIPKKARITVNVWAIGRDPNVWDDPENFILERFVRSSIDVRGQDFQLLPFGAGRRGCPGMQLGLTMVRLVVAQLVHCFDWELPDNLLPSELDMTEDFGLVTSRAKHLLAIPTYRLLK